MPPETLGTFAVTPDDIAATFRKPADIAAGLETPEIWDCYQEVADCIEQGLGCRATADALGIHEQPPHADFQRIQRRFTSWRKGKLPHSVKAVDQLHALGIFPGRGGYTHASGELLLVDKLQPFEPTNPRFEAIAMLSSAHFLNGTIGSKAAKGSSYTSLAGALCRRHEVTPEIRAFVKELTQEPHEKPNVISISNLQARLLAALGNIVGKRSNAGTGVLPFHLEAALGTLKSPASAPEETALAKRVLLDFSLAFFGLNKVYPHNDHPQHGQGYIRKLATQEAVMARAELVGEILGSTGICAPGTIWGPYQRDDLHQCLLDLEFDGDVDSKITQAKQEFAARLQELTRSLEDLSV